MQNHATFVGVSQFHCGGLHAREVAIGLKPCLGTLGGGQNFPQAGIPGIPRIRNGWFTMEHAIKMDDLWAPL